MHGLRFRCPPWKHHLQRLLQRLQQRQHCWPTILPARLLLRFDGHQQESGLLQLISGPHQQELQKPQSVDF
jgi:hypothetical protein